MIALSIAGSGSEQGQSALFWHVLKTTSDAVQPKVDSDPCLVAVVRAGNQAGPIGVDIDAEGVPSRQVRLHAVALQPF